MRRSRIILVFVGLAGLSSADWGLDPPAQQTPAQPQSAQQAPPAQQASSQQTSPPQQPTPPPANSASSTTQQSQQGDQGQAAQQPASLADVARKYREEKAAKEKSGAPQGALYTNEGVIPRDGTNALGMAPAARPNQSVGSAGRGGAAAPPSYDSMMASLDTAMTQMNTLAAADRATLVNAILKDNNVNFPGRDDWEARLMAGRDYYVAHGRQLNKGMRELLTQAEALHDSNPNLPDSDPRVMQLMNLVTRVTAEAKKAGDDFQNLMDEGRMKAKLAHPGVN